MSEQKNRAIYCMLSALAILLLSLNQNTHITIAQSTASPTQITFVKVRSISYIGLSKTSAPVILTNWNPNADLLAIAYEDDPNVYIFSPSDGKLRFKLTSSEPQDSVIDISWSQDGNFLAVAFLSDVVQIWSVSKNKASDPLIISSGRPYSVSWNSNSKQIAIVAQSKDKTKGSIWNSEKGTLLTELKTDTDQMAQLAWSPNGKLLATAYWEAGGVQIWNGTTFESLKNIPDIGKPISWNVDNKRLATTICQLMGENCTIKIWDVEKNQYSTSFSIDVDNINTLQWSPRGNLLAGSGTKKAEVWDAESGQLLADLGSSTDEMRTLSWNSDGNMIAGGIESGIVQIWEMKPN